MKITTDKAITKGIESFVNEFSEQDRVKYNTILKEYSERYGTNHTDLIKIITYNEVMNLR